MKRTLVVFDIVLIVLVALFAFTLFRNAQQQRQEVPLNVYDDMVDGGENVEAPDLNIDEIGRGIFASLTGTWKNTPEAAEDLELEISETTTHFNGAQYQMNVGGRDAELHLPYLTIQEKSGGDTLRLNVYPKGTYIPIRLADGNVDYTGEEDPTDSEQDRLLIGSAPQSAEAVKLQVFYRTS